MSVLSLRSSSFHAALRPVVPPPSSSAMAPTRRVASEMLLGGHRELVIQHHGSEYHLRLTRNGKLILTK